MAELPKNLGAYISIITLVLGIVTGYAVLQKTTKDNEIKVEKQEQRLRENEMLDVKQSVLIDQASERMMRQTVILEKLEKKL